jgi:hypothetical protein
MTTGVETEEPIPSWEILADRVLGAILEDASRCDPARAATYAGVDAERVRRAIDRADAIITAHRCYGDDEVIDVMLARSALLVVRGLVKPQMEGPDGR